MSKEEVTAANVLNVSTLTLLRIRTRNLGSDYERLWWCSHVDCDKVPFLYDSKEGDGDDDSRIQELRRYVALHVRVVVDLRAKVERSHWSKSTSKKCKKGGGSRRRMFLDRASAVEQELSRREQEELKVHVHRKHRICLNVQRPWSYTRNSAADFARIQRELEADEYGVTKQSRGEKLVAERGNAFERGDMVAVASVDATIAQRQATRRAARHRKKARKAAVAAQMRNYAFQNRTPDPLSDEERS